MSILDNINKLIVSIIPGDMKNEIKKIASVIYLTEKATNVCSEVPQKRK